MDSRIRWLKASFLAGAVADALTGVLILIPSRMGETEFRYPMGLAAALMFGWTFLLLWGWRKPVERMGILPLTICPVIVGLLASGFRAYSRGIFPFAKILPSTIVGLSLIVLMGVSWWRARDLRPES
jgi:hypothetical protein